MKNSNVKHNIVKSRITCKEEFVQSLVIVFIFQMVFKIRQTTFRKHIYWRKKIPIQLSASTAPILFYELTVFSSRYFS